MIDFTLDGKHITVFPGGRNSPVVYLPCFEEISASFNLAVAFPHSLVCISNIDWDNELSPWPADGLMRHDSPFGGKGGTFLKWLCDQVIPAVENRLDEPGYRIIAGYSLAGLFAVYTVYQSDLFSRCVSASGSLWYPGFVDYCAAHSFSSSLTHVYLSLGDKESLSRQPLLASVGNCTQEIGHLFETQGISTLMEWNPGSHFVDNEERMLKGIRWCMEQN